MRGRNFLTLALGLAAISPWVLARQSTSSSTNTSTNPPPALRRPASAPGTATAQVGGTWIALDKEGEQRDLYKTHEGGYSGGKWIEITYSRPLLRGRTNIFGSGADYGKRVEAGAQVWRAGANVTTRLKTEVPLEIGSKTISPGEYSLFVDLKESEWTLIVSRQPFQEKYDPKEKMATWGAYNYDPKYDVARASMTVVPLNSSHEEFSIAFVDMTDKGGKIAMGWEKTVAIVAFGIGQ
jgi:hypothetical protein